MKIRKGFVSNSSSSSFICEVCGDVQSGWDMPIEDAGMYRCENDHTFCDSHKITPTSESVEVWLKKQTQRGKQFKEWSATVTVPDNCPIDQKLAIYVFEEEGVDAYELPEVYCPICNLDAVRTEDVLSYLLKKLNLTHSNVVSEIQKTFKSHSDLYAFIVSTSKSTSTLRNKKLLLLMK